MSLLGKTEESFWVVNVVPTAEEEECSAEFQPIVQLQEVETVSGEEAENILGDLWGSSNNKLVAFPRWRQRSE